MDYEPVIGLEVHVELKTESKIFCPCPTTFGAEPNTNVCPVCLGLPGALPVINKKAIEYAVKAGLALHCQIASFSKMDRKNYYYPDLPKNYQISQYDLPLASKGYLEIEAEDGDHRIGITRAHLEEDAGKLVHQGSGLVATSLVDYNRTGIPLLEIVSEPELRSPGQARAYVEAIKAVIEYLDISDCKMEEGSLRVDANISIRPVGTTTLGVKAEIKNMNSFRSLQRALEYEIERQVQVLEEGGRIIQETRTWLEDRGITQSMRSKEQAQDYRYFPDPDLTPLQFEGQWVADLLDSLPEMPRDRRQRLVQEHGLPAYDAGVITASKALADFFDQCVERQANPKTVSNWIMGELLRLLNSQGLEPAKLPITPANLVELLQLIDQGTISGKIAKQVFEEMFNSGKGARAIVEARGLIQISNQDELVAIIDQVMAANPQSVADFQDGKVKALGFLVGQVMKESRGKANPQLVNQLLRERL